MSHHMLMPIVYTPEVKPKKLEPKKSRIQMRGAGSVDGADDAGETFEAAGILENRRIRVRGFVEARGGPRIEALRVGQIELLGAN